MYYLEIYDLKSYYKHVGSTHPRKKKILEFNVGRSHMNKAGYYKKKVTRKKLLELLKSRPMTREQLSHSLNISRSSVNYHLKKLGNRIIIRDVNRCLARLITTT